MNIRKADSDWTELSGVIDSEELLKLFNVKPDQSEELVSPWHHQPPTLLTLLPWYLQGCWSLSPNSAKTKCRPLILTGHPVVRRALRLLPIWAVPIGSGYIHGNVKYMYMFTQSSVSDMTATGTPDRSTMALYIIDWQWQKALWMDRKLNTSGGTHIHATLHLYSAFSHNIFFCN